MKKILTGAVAALTLGTGAALAGEWVFSGAGPELVAGYDNASIRVSGNRRTVWTVFVYRATDFTDGVPADYFLTRTTIDCVEETQSPTVTTFYTIDGSVTGSEDRSGTTRPIFPDSLLGGIMEGVCGDTKSTDLDLTVREFALAQRRDWYQSDLMAQPSR